MTREEFIALASASQVSLRRFLLALCKGNASIADDIAQEALVNAYVSFSSFRGSARFETWLFRIAYHCFIDYLRDQRIQTEPLDSSTAQALHSSDATDRCFQYKDLYQAIDALPEKERATLLLFYMEDRPVREIVQILGIPGGSVRAYLTRGRRHIKAYLEKWKTR